jgi:uncharacterized protein
MSVPLMQKLWLVLVLSVSPVAHAASFDCSKAQTPQEKAICASPALSKADDQMAAAYHVWLNAAQPEWKAGIRENQRFWLRELTRFCTAGNSSKSLESCLSENYRERIQKLRSMVQKTGGVTIVKRALVLLSRDARDDNPFHGEEVTPGYGTLQAQWPQAASSAQSWAAWNKAVESAALQAGSERKEPAAQTWNDLVQPGVDQEVTVIFERIDGELVSAKITNFVDGHGAHPNHNSTQFHWLLDEQRELKPEDIFVQDSGWDVWMQRQMDRYLHKVLDTDPSSNYQDFLNPGEMSKVLHGIVTNPSGWQLDNKGLTFFFNPYEVACYACTPEPFTISWADLKPYLRPGFTPLH